MTSILLIIIYLAFISLGLPDSLLGSAWPSMYQELGASVSWAGIISMIISAGTIISSLASDRLTRALGAGKVTAISVFMTAAALFGFSISHSFWILCLWAIPYGLGAGSVDAALNNFVALHYPARHMSWLHCMWGIGASVGPVIMGWAITGGLRWNGGYQIIAIIQIALTALLFVTLPLWKKAPVAQGIATSDNTSATANEPQPGTAAQTTSNSTADSASSSQAGTDTSSTGTAAASEMKRRKKSNIAAPQKRTLGQVLRHRGIKEVLICFFCYSALEATTGMWAASYCTMERGISAEQAAQWASLFYLGITIGRFVCGFITLTFNDRNMIRLGQAFATVGIICTLLPLGDYMLFAGLILIGCGCAPIYPSIIHETPINFGQELSQSVIGIQMAAAYCGSCLIPPLFGLIAQNITISLYPFFLAVILILMFIMSEKAHITIARAKARNRAHNRS